MKKLSNEKVHFSIITIYASYFGIPLTTTISVVMLATGFEKKDFSSILEHSSSFAWQIFYSLSSAISGLLSQVFYNISMKHEDASKAAIYRSTDFFFTYLFQYIWLDASNNFYSAFGALLIMIGTFLILIHKLIDKKLSQSNEKNKRLWKRILMLKF